MLVCLYIATGCLFLYILEVIHSFNQEKFIQEIHCIPEIHSRSEKKTGCSYANLFYYSPISVSPPFRKQEPLFSLSRDSFLCI